MCHLHGDLQTDFHHVGEIRLAFVGGELLTGDEVVADRADGEGALAEVGGGAVERGGLHLDGHDAHLAEAGVAPGGVIERVGRIEVAHGHLHAQLLRALDGGHEQVKVADGGVRPAQLILAGEVRVCAGALTGDDAAELEIGAHRARRADADDVLDAVLGIELVGVDGDGRHAHAAGHHGDGHALVGAGVALHAADVVDEDGVFKKGLGDELRAQRVAGHEDGFREIAGLGVVVGGRHGWFLLICSNLSSYYWVSVYSCFLQAGQ